LDLIRWWKWFGGVALLPSGSRRSSSSSAPFPHRHPRRSLIVITGPDPVICHGTYIVRREMAGSSPAMTLTSWQPGCDGEGETATHPGHFA
jgi:hypothetical protein